MEGVLPRPFSAVGSGYPVLHKPLRKPFGKPVGVVIRQPRMALDVFCGKPFGQTEVESDGPAAPLRGCMPLVLKKRRTFTGPQIWQRD